MLLAGCATNAADKAEVSSQGNRSLTSLELQIVEPTRTDVSYDSDNEAVHSLWSAGDRILVSDKQSGAPFTLVSSAAGGTNGRFSGTFSVGNPPQDIYTVYPYSEASLDSGNVYVNCPTTQVAGSQGQYDIKAAITSLTSSGEQTLTAPLQNLAAIIKLKLTLPSTLGGQDMSGEYLTSFTITATGVNLGGVMRLTGDVADGLSVVGTEPSITYTFADNTPATTATDALIFTAPADFSTSDARLDYTIRTTNYIITMRLSPSQATVAGHFYKFTFNLGSSAWHYNPVAVAAEREYSVKKIVSAEPQIIFATSTPHTVCVGWDEPASQTNRRYSLQIYADALMTTPLGTYVMAFPTTDNGFTAHPTRFTIGGLDPATTYYIRVKGNKKGSTTAYSTLTAVTTAPQPAATAKALVEQHFDLCQWGGDYINVAAGTRPDPLTQTTLAAALAAFGTALDSEDTFVDCTSDGGSLSDNFADILTEQGLGEWVFSSGVYVRPGYIQVGNTTTPTGSLITPSLSNLASGEHDITVHFDAAPFTADATAQSDKIRINMLETDGTVVKTTLVDIGSTPNDLNGDSPGWNSFSTTVTGARSRYRIQLSTDGYEDKFCLDNLCITSDATLTPVDHDSSNNLYGLVTSSNGSPLSGVVVSDGYQVNSTNSQGVYQFASQKANGYVFISIPSGYEVGSQGVMPLFYTTLESTDVAQSERHDFELSPVNNTNHVMLVIGDMHLANRTGDAAQFTTFTDELNTLTASYRNSGTPVYALTLGDMTWDIYWTRLSLSGYIPMINQLQNIEVFHTIGNHDHDCYQAGDWETVKEYKRVIGPTYYSFNIGNIHYVVLDNVLSKNDGTGADGRDDDDELTSDQISWLTKDLSYVDASKQIVVTMHEQAYKLTAPTTSTSAMNNISSLESVFGNRKVHYITGHTHMINNVEKSSTVYEHNAGSVCATWWWTGYLTSGLSMSRDGTPGGYTIYTVNGNSMSWVYKGVGLPLSRQFKTYDRNQIEITSSKYLTSGNASSTQKSSFDSEAKTAGYYYSTSNIIYGSSKKNKVYINVWNWDPSWSITVYDRGSSKNLSVTAETSAYDPLHLIAYNAKRYDAGSNPTSSFVTKPTQHIFSVTASSTTSTLDITVTDRFGNRYTETMTRPKSFSLNWN